MHNFGHILHPTDFSASSNQALKYACSLAVQYNAQLHLIHVLQMVIGTSTVAGFDVDDLHRKQVQYANEELSSLPESVVSYNGSLIRNVCEGGPFVEIIRYAKDNAIDLIVMGTHGYSGMKHLIMGSVAENVVRTAPCPVLTVHPEDYEFTMP